MTSQLARFARLLAFTAAPGLLALFAAHNAVTVTAVEAIVVPAAEVAWRSIFPTSPATTTPPPAPPAPPASGPYTPV